MRKKNDPVVERLKDVKKDMVKLRKAIKREIKRSHDQIRDFESTHRRTRPDLWTGPFRLDGRDYRWKCIDRFNEPNRFLN